MEEIQNLKARAYDLISLIEQAKIELQKVNERINELSYTESQESETKKTEINKKKLVKG